MRADVWMPFYLSDYLRDTMRLSRDEHGGYLLLIMACWQEGGSLPNDHQELANIAKATRSEWRKLAPKLLPYFQLINGRFVHKRVSEEYEKAKRLSELSQAKGRKGGRPRNNQGLKPGLKPGPKPNGKLDETPARVTVTNIHSSEFFPDSQFSLAHEDASDSEALSQASFEAFWNAYPRKVGKLAAQKAYLKARKSCSGPALLAAVVNFAFSADPQFIPHPASWLNKGRWLDAEAKSTPASRVGFV